MAPPAKLAKGQAVLDFAPRASDPAPRPCVDRSSPVFVFLRAAIRKKIAESPEIVDTYRRHYKDKFGAWESVWGCSRALRASIAGVLAAAAVSDDTAAADRVPLPKGCASWLDSVLSAVLTEPNTYAGATMEAGNIVPAVVGLGDPGTDESKAAMGAMRPAGEQGRVVFVYLVIWFFNTFEAEIMAAPQAEALQAMDADLI